MRKQKYLWMFLIGMLMSSCINTKKVVCLEDMQEEIAYPMNEQQELKIQRDDRLSIVINSRNPELTAPFNISSGEAFQVSESGNVTPGANVAKEDKGYKVDLNGYIEFPILGKLKVVDLTCKQVEELVKSRLIAENLIDDPLVVVDMMNLKITMMGEVESIGVLNVKDSRITLLEAITRAGGFTSNASLDKVAVIREENNERKMYMHDVRKTDIFYSSCFYLRQNDIVYVHPKFAPSTLKEQRTLGFYSLGVGLLGIISMIAVLLK